VSARHVAIVAPRFAGALQAGRKRIETRFSMTRRAPFGRVHRGDIIYFKPVGGPVIGRAPAARVVTYEQLTPARIDSIRQRHNHAILAPDAYWRSHRLSRYGVLIWLGRFSPRVPPLAIPRQFGSGWIILSR